MCNQFNPVRLIISCLVSLDSTWETEEDLKGKDLEDHVAAFKARQVCVIISIH